MTRLTIELIDPRAKVLLEGLAQMNLIKIQEISETQKRVSNLLSRLRSMSEEAPDLEEITAEVEKVRTERNQSKH